MTTTREIAVPSNSQAEQGILACILSYPRSVLKAVDIVKPEHFLSEDFTKTYEAILAVYRRGSVPNPTNVADELVRTQVCTDLQGTQYKLEHLADSLTNLQYIEDHIAQVLRTYKFRRLIDACLIGTKKAYNQEDDAFETMEELITALALDNDTSDVSPIHDAVDRYLAEYTERRKDAKEGKTQGLSTGFRKLDDLLRFRKSRLYILAARTSIGKTSLALNVGLKISQKAKRVLIYSLEMDEGELVQRLLSIESHIDQSLLENGETNDAQDRVIKESAKELKQLGMFLGDRTYTLERIKSEARALHMKKPLDLIIVDYLTLVDLNQEGRGKNVLRYEEVGKISKELKKLARELKVPILALAQLNRKSEESELPQIHHLGESDKIGQDADCVMFIHVDESELEKRNNSQPYRLNIIIRKHRNGRLGQAALMFRPHLTRFDDLTPEEEV